MLEVSALVASFSGAKAFIRSSIVRLGIVLGLATVFVVEVAYPVGVYLFCEFENRKTEDPWKWVYDKGEFYLVDSARGLDDSTYDGRITLWPPSVL